MIQMHDPDLIVVDLRNAGRMQCDQIWALLWNAQHCRCIAVVHTAEVVPSAVPPELSSRVQVVEQEALDSDLTNVAQVVADSIAGKKDSTISDAINADRVLQAGVFNSVADLTKHGDSNTHNVTETADLTYPTSDSGGSIADRYRTKTDNLRHMLERLQVAAQHDVTILLTGETGSGKTYLARLIHAVSSRESRPFVTVACGALPGELIESELFGHVRGAFTSAHADKDGRFMAAGRGTILLDEIDVLTPEQQVKLLRVIETGQFEAVGSNRTLQVEARIIAASNLELQPLVEQGRFRPDLYYRLNTLTFRIPPLRKRLPDIELLARHFVHSHALRHGIGSLEISQDFLSSLLSYPWPGNVREMENAIRSAVIYSKNGVLTAGSLPPDIVEGTSGPANDPSVARFFRGTPEATLENRIELTEKDIIEQALLENSFIRTSTARQLGISRVTLYNKMKKYGMMQGKRPLSTG
ncbi:MAG: sigma-54 dependent transcriptional regulator [Fuerstiella sp.]|nr:sigma-54 dependent transcriptional regulator [Fuerstiella sp.]